MKEISAHMDNIVQRLSAFFPPDDARENQPDTDASPCPPPAAPALPELPLPPPEQARDRVVSARVMTVDRAVSARRLTTDRAVSVASGLHFEDELSGTGATRSLACTKGSRAGVVGLQPNYFVKGGGHYGRKTHKRERCQFLLPCSQELANRLSLSLKKSLREWLHGFIFTCHLGIGWTLLARICSSVLLLRPPLVAIVNPK